MIRYNKFQLMFISLVLTGSGCYQQEDHKGGNHFDSQVEEKPVQENIIKVNLPSENYIDWVRNPENGLIKVKVIDDIKFMVQYKPYEYIAYMEEEKDKITDSLLKRKTKELEGKQYYDLKILLNNDEGELLKAGLNSHDDYEKRVKYFSFGMQHDIQLVDGADTLPCEMYHFERAYDVTPVCTVLLGFDKKEENALKPKTLLVYDRTFNKGLLKFTFKEKRLQTLPKLLTL